jgi:hypothetical protein
MFTELPDWPRYLSRQEAARYLGVSVDVFDDEVRAGTWPAGIRRGAKGGLLSWDKRLLDRWRILASGSGPGAPTSEVPGTGRLDAASLAWEAWLDGPPNRNRA